MKNGFAGLSNKRMSLRRWKPLVWLVAAGVLGVTAVAGQALGPVLAGGAGGNAGLVASQNLFFTRAGGAVGFAGDINQAAANIDTAGLIVTGVFGMHRGDPASALTVHIQNRGSATRSANLFIEHDAGVGVDLSTLDPDMGLAQASIQQMADGRVADCYLITLVGDEDADLDMDIAVGTADGLGSHHIVLRLQEIP